VGFSIELLNEIATKVGFNYTLTESSRGGDSFYWDDRLIGGAMEVVAAKVWGNSKIKFVLNYCLKYSRKQISL